MWLFATTDSSRSWPLAMSSPAKNWSARILPTGTEIFIQDVWHAQAKRLPQLRQDDCCNWEGVYNCKLEDVPVWREFSGTVLRVAQGEGLLPHSHQLHDIWLFGGHGTYCPERHHQVAKIHRAYQLPESERGSAQIFACALRVGRHKERLSRQWRSHFCWKIDKPYLFEPGSGEISSLLRKLHPLHNKTACSQGQADRRDRGCDFEQRLWSQRHADDLVRPRGLTGVLLAL